MPAAKSTQTAAMAILNACVMVYLLNQNFGLTWICYEIKVNNLAPQGVLRSDRLETALRRGGSGEFSAPSIPKSRGMWMSEGGKQPDDPRRKSNNYTGFDGRGPGRNVAVI